MANIKGASNPLPGAYSDVFTQSKGLSLPGGTRISVLVGEGSRSERLVVSALGAGKDGFNKEYTSTNGSDGRHFQVAYPPMISNRTTVYKNGLPLVGLEKAFDSNSGSFSSKYDYRVDITTGHIELQTASLVDQNGSYFTASSANQGTGTIAGLTLVDTNAPTETWTIRCSTTRKDGNGDPIDGYAKFIAQGSVSGILLDGYGNQITWQSDDQIISNGIISFALSEGLEPFHEGDRFTVKVKSGALSKGDSLTVSYISESDLNDPEFFTDLDLLHQKHGMPSTTNRLSLGAQLAFASSPPGIYACQAAPSIPRRVSYPLQTSATGGATLDDLSFYLPLGVVPDVDSNINFFITDPVTKVETQILPNKVDFYDASYTSSPGGFCFGVHAYSYTVVLEDSVVKQAEDGVITSIGPSSATLSSQLVNFDISDEGKTLVIPAGYTNAGTYTISDVTDGVATITGGSFTDATDIEFHVVDADAQSAVVLLTDDLALGAGQSLRVTVVDQKDADFYDANWQNALEALEAIECDIVVPLPSQTISSIFGTTVAHCNSMSSIENRKERIPFIGAIQGLTPDNVTGVKAAAVEDLGVLEGIQGDSVSEILAGNVEDLTNYGVPNSFGNTFRCVYGYPDEIVVQVGADRTKVNGFFAMAAVAGYCSSNPNIEVPLTNKVIPGFTILRDKLYRPAILKNLTAAGIFVLQPAVGGGKVVWSKTTTQSGYPEEEELSIVFIRDRIAKSIRQAMEGFAGNAESPTTQGTIMARAMSALQSFVGQNWITAFADLRVYRDSVDPRQWNISVAVQPTYPINWIYIRIGLGVL